MLGSKIAASLALSLSLAAAPVPQFDDEPLTSLPLVDVKLHAWGVEFISSDGESEEREQFIVDHYEYAMAPDPVTATECANLATVTCGQAGVAWLRYRYNATTGDYTCEFGCNTTGTGG